MLNRKYTKDYVSELAKEFGLSRKQVQAILSYGMKNVCKLIRAGDEIRLRNFGVISYHKEPYGKYIQKCRQISMEKAAKDRNSRSNNDLVQPSNQT